MYSTSDLMDKPGYQDLIMQIRVIIPGSGVLFIKVNVLSPRFQGVIRHF